MTITTRYLTGPLYNLLSRGTTSPSTFDTSYPPANLYDNLASLPWKAQNASGSFEYVTVDGNLNSNFGLENWSGGVPQGWLSLVTGTGTVAETTTAGEVVTGSAAKLGGGAAGSAFLYKDITVRAGEWLTFEASIRGDGAAGQMLVQVYNRQTDHYLQIGGGSWGASAFPFSRTANTHANQSVHFQVESMATCLASTVTLRIQFIVTGNGFGYVDNVAMWPDVDFMGVFGHSIDPRSACNFNSSTNNFSTETLEKSLTVDVPSFYGVLPARVARRYWRLLINGPFVRVPGVAELVIGQMTSFTRGPDAPHLSPQETSAERPQVRLSTGSGDEYVFQRSAWERRTRKLSYSDGESGTAAFIREIHRRSENGQYPLILVTDDSLPEVIMGRLESSRSSQRVSYVSAGDTWAKQDFVVRELAFPQFAT